MWADVSNTNGGAVDGAALTSIGCTTLAAKPSQGTDFTDWLLGDNFAQQGPTTSISSRTICWTQLTARPRLSMSPVPCRRHV